MFLPYLFCDRLLLSNYIEREKNSKKFGYPLCLTIYSPEGNFFPQFKTKQSVKAEVNLSISFISIGVPHIWKNK